MPPLFGRLDAGMVAAFGSMGGLSFLAIIGTLAFMPSSHGTSRHRKRPSFREMGRSPLVRGVFATRVTENIGARPSPPSCRFSPA